MDRQADFLLFHLEHLFGKRMQIVIYANNAIEGHALYAVNGMYLHLQYQHYCYIVWKVVLIEDAILLKEY